MKYFKFKQVCSQSGISVGIKPPCLAGPWWPDLPGLEVILIGDLYGWCYGTASDEAEPNDDNFILEITLEQITAVLDAHYANEKTKKLEEITADYNNVKAQLIEAGEAEEDFLPLLDQAKAAVDAVVNNFSATPVETSHIRWQETEELGVGEENKEIVLKHNPHLYKRYLILKNA